MKVRQKLTLILLAGNLMFFLVCAGFFLFRMKEFYLDTAVENYEAQMSSMEYVFSEIVSDRDFGTMGDMALEAYLNYQFRRCFGDGYAFLKGQECLVNLTEFQVLDPAAFQGAYMVQDLGKRTVLLMKREIQGFEGYQVLLAQDITAYDLAVRQQMEEFLVICGGILAVAAAAVYLLLLKVLRPLEVLTRTAKELGDGNLTARAEIREIDEIGVLAGAFNQMADQVKRQVDDLRLLLGALTHEIKTPMTSIIGYAETLRSIKLPEEKREQALTRIVQSGRRMERLSAKMLAMLGTYETDDIAMEPVSVRELLAAVGEEAFMLLEEKQLQLLVKIEAEDQEGPWFFGDRELLESLLFNLLHNAIKASEPEGRIWLKADQNGISVTDEGIGISKDDLPHVMEAFYMADKSRSRSEGGSGLGLALCQRIAELHHMELHIESELGRGTTAGIYLIYKSFTI